MEDFELILFDRLEMIRSVLQYVPDERCYISFSGGKDSAILSHMIDEALPNNKIKRVFCNTGIEYKKIVEFVKKQTEQDDRFEIITAGKNIKQMLEEDGYPYKSKHHSEMVGRYQSGISPDTVQKYLDSKRSGVYTCPESLQYQFTPDFDLKISAKCCQRLKKEPFKKYVEDHGITITLTGIREAEKGMREYQAKKLGCVLRDKNGEVYRFNPLLPCSDEFCDWYVKSRNIELCELYYPPYNFKRTGCLGCPFNVNLRKDLDLMKELLPSEYKQACTIWKPVYDEMSRMGYRKMFCYDMSEEEYDAGCVPLRSI